MKSEPVVVLLVEDDLCHAELVRRNLEVPGVAHRLMHVADGQAALDYLYHRAEFSDARESPRPSLVLLDLRIPKIHGLDVLATIKSDPDLRGIPVVILTTSSAEPEIAKAYACHANSYLIKPMDFDQFTAMMKTLGCYWLAWNRTDCSKEPCLKLEG
ncbi:MAG: response regulator [Pirellulales bacterium]